MLLRSRRTIAYTKAPKITSKKSFSLYYCRFVYDKWCVIMLVNQSVEDIILSTVRETMSHQANVLNELANQVCIGNYTKTVELIVDAVDKRKGKVVVSGMGKSGIVGQKIAASLASNTVPAIFVHPGEAYHGDLGMIQEDDVVILISNSGETDEILKLVAAIKLNFNNPIVAITCKPTSTLSLSAEAILLLHVDRESCPNNLAPTASTTATICVGDALVCALIKVRGTTPHHFAKNHPGGSLGRRLLIKLKDEMVTTNLPIVNVNDDIKKTFSVHSQSDVNGFSIVMDGDELVGCFTDGDMRRAFDKGMSISTKLSEVMTHGCHTVDVDASLTEADEIMALHNINHLVVTQYDNVVVGIYVRNR